MSQVSEIHNDKIRMSNLKQAFDVFWVFLRLGVTSFGGPVAHLSFFFDEFVTRRKWMDSHSFGDLVALCQFLPGPASSQIGMLIGFNRAGVLGSLAAWLGFTAPSAILLVLFSMVAASYPELLPHGALNGLKIAAVAVVAQALLAMGPKLCPDIPRLIIASVVAIILGGWSSVGSQLLLLFVGGFIGVLFLSQKNQLPQMMNDKKLGTLAGGVFLATFILILFFLPVLVEQMDSPSLTLFNSFYRSGSLVFGGGHVVLPLLQVEVVNSGWVTLESFMVGYGAAQAIPGPLFSFSSYLGAVASIGPGGWIGGALCLFAIFLPSFLLVLGVLPFWNKLRSANRVRSAMLGINAAVVGLLLGAFFNPVWPSAIHNYWDLALAIVAFVILVWAKLPSWLVVIFCAAVSGLVIA